MLGTVQLDGFPYCWKSQSFKKKACFQDKIRIFSNFYFLNVSHHGMLASPPPTPKASEGHAANKKEDRVHDRGL